MMFSNTDTCTIAPVETLPRIHHGSCRLLKWIIPRAYQQNNIPLGSNRFIFTCFGGARRLQSCTDKAHSLLDYYYYRRTVCMAKCGVTSKGSDGAHFSVLCILQILLPSLQALLLYLLKLFTVFLHTKRITVARRHQGQMSSESHSFTLVASSCFFFDLVFGS